MASMEIQPEITLGLIKPDAASTKAEEIMQLIELSGFTIVAKQKMQLSTAAAEEFYAEHKGKPFFPGLVEFMTSGPLWALALSKEGAIKAWRELMGPTNAFEARVAKPKCLRALYGTDGTRNATHGSDSPTSAAREVKFFFPRLSTTQPALDTAAAQDYVRTKLQPTLVKALTALAREKPTNSKTGAIRFLAQWLLENNPNKPQVVAAPGAAACVEDTNEFSEVATEASELVLRAQVVVNPSSDLPDPEVIPPPAPAAAAAGGAARSLSQHSRNASAKLSKQTSAVGGGGISAVAVQQEGAVGGEVGGGEEGKKVELEDQAATKVQAAFRGHQARKHVAAMKVEGQQ